MITLTLTQIAEIASGRLIGQDQTISALNTDSRTLVAGEVFLALKGENFDGHQYLAQAQGKGCSAVIVEQTSNINIAQIVVKDTRQALADIGAYVKATVAPKTVAITGSSGKTTVKEMTAAILSRLGNVLATKGNFNNDIGVPLTLLRLTPAHDFAVIELGANHQGEIAFTSALVKPDVALINNIAAAHLAGFGDLNGVATAKGEIFTGLVDGGTAIYQAQNPWANIWQSALENKKVFCFSDQVSGEQAHACYAQNIRLDRQGRGHFTLCSAQGEIDIKLPLVGEHNIYNALGAASIALAFDASLADIQQGLMDMDDVKGRLNVIKLTDNMTVIDDTYNANVESVKAAIRLLANYQGKQLLILGDMAELGTNAEQYHQEIGYYAKENQIDTLLTVGTLSKYIATAFYGHNRLENLHFSEHKALLAELKPQLLAENKPLTILVKGSRSAGMEKIVSEIINWHQCQQNQEPVLC